MKPYWVLSWIVVLLLASPCGLIGEEQGIDKDEKTLEEAFEEGRQELEKAENELKQSLKKLERPWAIEAIRSELAKQPGSKRYLACVYSKSQDELTGTVTESVSSISLSEEIRFLKPVMGALQWKCSENSGWIIVLIDTYFSPYGVMYRFSNQKEATYEAINSRTMDMSTLIYFSDSLGVELTELAKPAEWVMIRTVAESGESYTFKFNLMGLTRALKELSCWSSEVQKERPSAGSDILSSQVPPAGEQVEGSGEQGIEEPPPDIVPFEKPPEVLNKVLPVYPDQARRSDLEGTVWFKIWVDKEGKVRDVVILKSDSEIFNRPIFDAVKQWIFSPALMNGSPVAAWVATSFSFKLK